jgi:uncharacterized protein YdcH (DUF465 family)
MEHTQDELKAHLMQTNEEFRRWAEQHAEYKRQINDLEAKGLLSPDEEIEEHRLKKLKLAAKDHMVEILAAYKAQPVS